VYLRIFSEENKFWARDTMTYQTGEGVIHGRLPLAEDGFEGKYHSEYPFDALNQDVENFIHHNWKKILSTTRADLLEVRQKFFHKSGLNPSIHDITLQTIQYLLENKYLRTKKELKDTIYKNPFINEQLREFEKQNILSYFDDDYFEKQNREIVFTSREEIVKLKEREFFLKKEVEIGRNIEEKLKKEYEEKERNLKNREREIETAYEIFKSKIDDYPSLNEKTLPKSKKSISVKRDNWYEELGLRENPFLSHIGLESINESRYNDIIVKTDIFHKFDDAILTSSEPIQRRSYLIYGEMGSGKTTLFRYLQKTISILKANTFTLFIPLESKADFERIRCDFYQKLYEKLEYEYFSKTKSPTQIERDTITDSTILYLFKQLSEIVHIDNFIIFIDDLHKHPKYIGAVFEFISGLQIFRSYMYENGINLTLFISGDLAWISDAEGVKAIGGSIDTREKIPEITIDDAVEMINKRLNVFAKNPEKPPTIKSEHVETVFKILKARTTLEVTFRDVIEEMEKHWKNYEFESLKLSVILDFNTLSSMMLDLETDHPRLKEKLDHIWDYAGKDEGIFNQFIDTVEALDSKGVSEDCYEFENNRDYYGALYRAGLISKQRRKNSFAWVLAKDARDMFRKFEAKYGGFRPPEYLSKMYLKDEFMRTYVSEESSRMSMILKTGETYGGSFLGLIKDALDTYRMIFKHTTSIEELYNSQELLDICKKSVTSLMKATLIVCESKDIKTRGLYDVYEEFTDNWFQNPELTEFVDLLQKKEMKETPLNRTDIDKIGHDYFRAVKTLISNLQRFMKYNKVFPLDSKFIHIKDKKRLDNIRRNFYNDNYDLALGKANTLVAHKLRGIIYTVNCLIYGQGKWRSGFPPEINERLGGMDKKDFNERSILNNLSLTNLVSIILKSDDITEKIFRALFGDETWEATKKTLVVEKQLQNANSELRINSTRKEILDYLLQIKIIIEKVDSFHSQLFVGNIPFQMNYWYFGISLKKEDQRFLKYEIKDDILSGIAEKIDEEKIL
jgi:hypothetical protein